MRDLHNQAISIVLLSGLMGFSISCSNRPSDETITKDIQNRIAADPETKDSDVAVTAKDGKVTLTGTTHSQAAHQKLEQIAREEPGAAGLDDQISVAPPPQPIVVPAGTVLVVTLGQPLSSKTSQTGQTFLAHLAQPVSVDGRTTIPKGSTVNGMVVVAKAQGKIKGEGQLSLTLRSITVRGQTYPIQTDTSDSTVKGKGKRTAAITGGGAAGGALIGGLAGGGKGAAIGALAGAGAGLIGGAATGTKQIELPAESALSFTLSTPLTLPPRGK